MSVALLRHPPILSQGEQRLQSKGLLAAPGRPPAALAAYATHEVLLTLPGQLSQSVSSLDKTQPIVTVCRSGGRSGQALVLLKKAGFEKVASMAGGMLRYRAEKRK